MQYLAPCDLLETALPADSVDIVTSRNLLGRYAEPYARSLLPALSKVLKKGGAISFCI